MNLGITETGSNAILLSQILAVLRTDNIRIRVSSTATGTTSIPGGFKYLTIKLPETVTGTITIDGIPYTTISANRLIEFPQQFSGSDISVVAGANTIYVTRVN